MPIFKLPNQKCLTMINAILIDDEPGSIITLKTLLEGYCPGVNVVATTGNPLDAIGMIKELNPDLVFLDIEMPFANAFDLLDQLKPISFEVVFITAFNDYALKAFKYAAVDYLLKPVNISELQTAVERAQKVMQGTSRFNERVNGLLGNLQQPVDEPGVISVPSAKGYDLIELAKIIYITALGNYAEIHSENGMKMTVSKGLKELEEQLPPLWFFRIHHSYIVNLNKVHKYIRGRGGKVILSDNTTIEVAARKKNEFLTSFKNIRSNGSGQ